MKKYLTLRGMFTLVMIASLITLAGCGCVAKSDTSSKIETTDKAGVTSK